MTKTCAEMLNEIDEFFADADYDERNRLWNILAALRGPDNEDQDLKRNTTGIIRAHAFPKSGDQLSIVINKDASLDDITLPPLAQEQDHHFYTHIYMARESLKRVLST